jgi:predicted nucleic acid-binding protein
MVHYLRFLKQVSGVPNWRKSLDSLILTFKRTLVAVQQIEPDVVAQVTRLNELRKEFEALHAKHKAGEISEEDFLKEKNIIVEDIKKLEDIMSKLNSSYQIVKSAIDPENLSVLKF